MPGRLTRKEEDEGNTGGQCQAPRRPAMPRNDLLPDPPELRTILRAAMRHGGLPGQLASTPPGHTLVDVLTPGPEAEVWTRAVTTSQRLAEAINRLVPPVDAAMRALWCLADKTRTLSLTRRRVIAAHFIEVSPRTLENPRFEGALLLDLAVELARPPTAG